MTSIADNRNADTAGSEPVAGAVASRVQAQAQALGLRLRPMELDDVEGVAALERQCFATPWSARAFRRELRQREVSAYWVLMREDELLGYAGMWVYPDEGHITNVAAAPQYRHRGLGRLLVCRLLAELIDRAVDSATLEVRYSNEPARQLYHSFGFVEVALRRRYYRSPVEDAVIMWLQGLTAGEYRGRLDDQLHRVASAWDSGEAVTP